MKIVKKGEPKTLTYLSLVAVVLGVMLFLAGFLGELINRNSSDRNSYLIDDVVGADDDEVVYID